MRNSRPIVVLDSAIPFLGEALAPYCEVRARVGAAITAADVSDADALVVRTRTRCDEALLASSKVRVVITATIGFDHIDRDWCEANGIRVVTAAGCNARGVLQWVSAVLALLAERDGWRPEERTLGIVGVGHVGGLVKAYAEAWGFRVLCCDPPREEREKLGFRSVEEVAREADIITFHTPLDETTHHLVDERLLALMKPEAVVINSSRGAVVDNAALLADGKRCALDVWEGEPRLNEALLRRAEVATPHVAGYTAQGKANASAIAAEVLAEWFELPLRGWYPSQVALPEPRPIAWEAMCTSIKHYCDLEGESERLKREPETFESQRDHYTYREEYF
ncbi:MAG: 4-phosphoerythronate dehydrogenase [Rikenellaceae bacterium]|nr:4-phosphoerythronate dehydrogenase [Rikenellaceae bacterium]